MTEKTNKSSAARVTAHKQRLLAAGGKKIYLSLQPEAVQAADALVTAGYARYVTATINKALQEVAARYVG